MGTTAPSVRSFTALTGIEVKNAILADIKRQMDADYHFTNHLSYSAISWKFKAAFDVYPNEIGSFEVNAGATLHPAANRPIEEGEQPESFDLEGGRRVTAGFEAEGQSADSVRRETGQPVMSIKTVSGPGGERISVEAPSVPSVSVTERPAKTETNVPSSKGIVARRAVARTKAAPEGLSVERSGSPPTAEDAEKIIEQGLADGTLQKRQ